MQVQVGQDIVFEAVDVARSERDALLEGPLQLTRHDGDVLLFSEKIHECEADELDILFLDEGQNIFTCIHKIASRC